MIEYNKIISSLNDKKTNEFINNYFGNNAINTTELNHMFLFIYNIFYRLFILISLFVIICLFILICHAGFNTPLLFFQRSNNL